MPHFYSPPRRQFEDPDQVYPAAAPASEVRPPERIPGFIDALDCLLALWIAEARLDSEAEEVAGDLLPSGLPVRRSRSHGG